MVAAALGIPFQAVDLKLEFEAIIRYFVSEYGHGRTPNPCAVCNRDLKMGRLFDFADELGCAGVATGHYARIEIEAGRVHLLRGRDPRKDQSYQLFPVAERHLARTSLPLGSYEKSQVRELAERAGLRTSHKADSQEVCFIPSNDYRQLLSERGAELHPGQIVDTSGRRLGDHGGTEHFTIGQRRGHGVASDEPLYVVATLPDEGLVVLGTRDECRATGMEVDGLNWIGFDPADGDDFRCQVQYRYHCVPADATVRVSGASARVEFDAPQLAVAPRTGSRVLPGRALPRRRLDRGHAPLGDGAGGGRRGPCPHLRVRPREGAQRASPAPGARSRSWARASWRARAGCSSRASTSGPRPMRRRA